MASSVSPKVFAIVPAGGSSQRMGTKKLLLPLGGDSVLRKTLKALLAVNEIAKIVLALPEDAQDYHSQISDLDNDKICVCTGGASRMESVANALKALNDITKPESQDLVLVHDAARCFVSQDLIQRCIAAAKKHGAVTAALPAIDSLKKFHPANGKVIASLDRSEICLIQTPQVFSYSLIAAAHSNNIQEATDDASLVEKLAEVYIVNGEPENFKITTPNDYSFAKFLVANS